MSAIQVNAYATGGPQPTWNVEEVSATIKARHIASFSDGGQVKNPDARGRAEARASFMSNEHGQGRVAQGRCSHGAPCDRDRIHAAESMTGAERDAVVLCGPHGQEVDRMHRPSA